MARLRRWRWEREVAYRIEVEIEKVKALCAELLESAEIMNTKGHLECDLL